MSQQFYVDPDIKKAETLPATFYKDPEVFERLRENVFVRTWQWIGDESLVSLPESVYPFVLLNNFLTEPMVLTRDREDKIRCLSNVCTHRGNIVAQGPGQGKGLRCMYHGRKFELSGRFRAMPEFQEVENFPAACDDLHEFRLCRLGPFLFTGLDPAFDFSEIFDVMNERIGFLPLRGFKYDERLSKDYLVNCHWALYCDNYLEGFHIPFIHEDLNRVLDHKNYITELYNHVNLQIGYSGRGQEVFELPEEHIDHGKNVAAYYYWIFPNMMFNFYPWGLSINIVKPLSINKTKVSFISYVYDDSKLSSGAGALLDKVEREDEFVVEGVQKGLQSRFYKSGRFSPSKETGTHHFHSLLAKYVNGR